MLGTNNDPFVHEYGSRTLSILIDRNQTKKLTEWVKVKWDVYALLHVLSRFFCGRGRFNREGVKPNSYALPVVCPKRVLQ